MLSNSYLVHCNQEACNNLRVSFLAGYISFMPWKAFENDFSVIDFFCNKYDSILQLPSMSYNFYKLNTKSNVDNVRKKNCFLICPWWINFFLLPFLHSFCNFFRFFIVWFLRVDDPRKISSNQINPLIAIDSLYVYRGIKVFYFFSFILNFVFHLMFLFKWNPIF